MDGIIVRTSPHRPSILVQQRRNDRNECASNIAGSNIGNKAAAEAAAAAAAVVMRPVMMTRVDNWSFQKKNIEKILKTAKRFCKYVLVPRCFVTLCDIFGLF